MFRYRKKSGIENLEKSLDLISKKVGELNLPKGFFEFIMYVISELISNVREHSKTNKASLTLMLGKRKCLIGVADNGVGLKQPYLSKGIYVKDDFAAIELALNGLSTKNLGERGFGLYSIRKLAEELNGEMTIESNFAKALIQKNKINFSNLRKKMRGVAVEIEAPVKKIDFYKIIV